VGELLEHFGKGVFAKLLIGYYNKGQNAGGRLMSAFGGGALGLLFPSQRPPLLKIQSEIPVGRPVKSCKIARRLAPDITAKHYERSVIINQWPF